MIRISVGGNWVVTSDCYQFILNKKKTVLSGDKKGQEYLEATAYYAKIDQLVKGLLHFHIRDSDVITLAELACTIEEIGNACHNAIMHSIRDKA